MFQLNCLVEGSRLVVKLNRASCPHSNIMDNELSRLRDTVVEEKVGL